MKVIELYKNLRLMHAIRKIKVFDAMGSEIVEYDARDPKLHLDELLQYEETLHYHYALTSDTLTVYLCDTFKLSKYTEVVITINEYSVHQSLDECPIAIIRDRFFVYERGYENNKKIGLLKAICLQDRYEKASEYNEKFTLVSAEINGIVNYY